VFDQYHGPGLGQGKKGLAFRIVMQDTEKTLTEEEIEATKQRLVSALAARCNARLRT
jgi:phenylalanyl-tRNA synthetase beta chain